MFSLTLMSSCNCKRMWILIHDIIERCIVFGTEWPNFFRVILWTTGHIYEQSLHCNFIFLLHPLKLIPAQTLKLKRDERKCQISPKKLEGYGVLLNTTKDTLVLYGSLMKIVPWDIKYWREIPFCYEMWKLMEEFMHSFFFDWWTLEDGTHRLSQNVSN